MGSMKHCHQGQLIIDSIAPYPYNVKYKSYGCVQVVGIHHWGQFREISSVFRSTQYRLHSLNFNIVSMTFPMTEALKLRTF